MRSFVNISVFLDTFSFFLGRDRSMGPKRLKIGGNVAVNLKEGIKNRAFEACCKTAKPRKPSFPFYYEVFALPKEILMHPDFHKIIGSFSAVTSRNAAAICPKPPDLK